MNDRWRPSSQNSNPDSAGSGGPPRPKAKLRNVEEILQTATSVHTSYHIPPGEYSTGYSHLEHVHMKINAGTSRTRRAQENYMKNVDTNGAPAAAATAR